MYNTSLHSVVLHVKSIIQITTTCSTLTGVLLMAPVISFLRSGAAVAAAVLPAAVHEEFLLDLVHMHTSV